MNQTFYTSPEEPIEPNRLPRNSLDPVATRRHFSMIGVGYFLLMAGLYVASMVIQLLLEAVWPSSLTTWWMSWVLSFLPLYGAGLPLLWMILRRVPSFPHNTDCKKGYRDTSEKPRFSFGHWMILLTIGLGCMYAGGIVGNISMGILSEIMEYDYANSLNSIVTQSPVWATFIGICICAPLGEELLFRKLLVDRVRGYGDLTAILLSGLLFALFHGNLFQFFYALLLGMILAYVYTRSGNVWWSVAMHSVVNFLGSIVIPKLAEFVPADGVSYTTPLEVLVTLFLMLWQYGLIIAAIVLICVLWHRRKLSAGCTPLYRENGPSLVILNAGMIACLATMCLLLALSLIPIRV